MELEYVNCNICGSDNYDIFYHAIRQKTSPASFKSSSVEPGKDQIVKCSHCGLIYVNPRLKQKAIIKGYSEGSDERFISQARSREMTFERSIKLIEKYAKTKGKLLDIGTAGGSFLAVAKRNGWKVEGIEPNKWLCEWGKKHYGITIKQGTLEKNSFKKRSFDLVTLWDVLEHVSDPTNTLKRINSILKKNGLAVVNYPDISSPIAKLMHRKWVFILTVHLYYFTPMTIKRLLKKCGFKILVVKKHWQTLSLGYLADRLEPYTKIGHKIATKTINALHLEKMRIKYWLGQTFVIAKKVREA